MDILKEIEKVPPAPKEIRKWILDKVVKNTYIIYDKKKGTAYCTRCGNEFDITLCEGETKHNASTNCPCCDYPAIFKASRIGRKNLIEMTRTLDFVRKGKTIYGVLAEINITFEEKEPRIHRWISAVYKFNSKEQSYFKHYPGWCYGSERWNQHKQVKVPSVPSGSFYYSSKRDGLSIYTDNFKIFETSDLKYADVPKFYNQGAISGEELIRYMDLSLKYQSIELLRKSGFELLVLNKVSDISSRAINWRGKDLRKILKLNMREIRKFRDKSINGKELEIYQTYRKSGVLLELDEIALINHTYQFTESAIQEVTTLVKAAQYIAKQNREYQKHSTLGDYKDYIEDCIKLGLDIRKNIVLFPADFYKEHIELVDRIHSLEDKKVNKNILKRVSQLEHIANIYEYGDLIIRPAVSQGELREESAGLGHCVKGYGDKIARGECVIFFIRRIDEANKPFYTLELKDKKVTQCRGNGNCSMTDEVKQFVNKWMAEIVNAKPKKRKKVA